MQDDIAIGTRVWARSVEGKDLGEGVYQGVVPMGEALKEDSQIPAPSSASDMSAEESTALEKLLDQYIEEGGTTPKIKLDSGEIVYGFQCYWAEV